MRLVEWLRFENDELNAVYATVMTVWEYSGKPTVDVTEVIVRLEMMGIEPVKSFKYLDELVEREVLVYEEKNSVFYPDRGDCCEMWYGPNPEAHTALVV